jgi:hypothetical protein
VLGVWLATVAHAQQPRRIELGLDVGMLRERFGLTTADELGIRQASNLIDELKSDERTSPGTNGNGAYATTGGAR